MAAKALRRVAVLLALAAAVLVATPGVAFDPPAPHGSGGAAATAAPAATETAITVLRRGGNAVDAAVAAALALAVVHPQAGNLGGGGFAVVRFKGEAATLDFRETAPAAARPDMYLDGKGEPVRERSLVGPLAAGVPGSPVGLYELHKRYGVLPWKDVVAPAYSLAADGFVVTERLARELDESRTALLRFPETAAVWLPGGAPPAAGSVMRLPQLAATLEAYAEQGPEAITDGPLAMAIEETSRRHGGILRAHDLAAYRAVWRDPVRFRAYGWEVASMSLPSSGGIILAETLGLLERRGWAALPRGGAARAHLLVEAWRRAYADRFLLGDPRTTEALPPELLAPARLDRLAARISTGAASPSATVHPGAALAVESPETTHLSVVDGDGDAVALTTTLNGRFGCGLLVPAAGFLLNNEMDDFAAAPGRPNLYGLVQGEANAVGAGKRMLSSMSPTVAWRRDEVLALGTPGGSRIPTTTVQVFLNLVVDGDPLQAAVDRPRIHHQWLPDKIEAEPDALSPETASALTALGHTLRGVAPFAEVEVVHFEPGRVEAAADPRGPGSAAVVRQAEGSS